MQLTKPQIKKLDRYAELRNDLHMWMARVSHANLVGDTGTRLNVARARMKSLASQTALAAKNAGTAIPVVRDEIGEQHAEDDRDYDALKSGVGIVVIGGDDREWTVELIESLSPGWFYDRKNRELTEMGYNPFEIDPDLRLMSMLRSVGFGGVGAEMGSIAKRIARLRKRLRHYRLQRRMLRQKLRAIPRNDKGAYAQPGRARKLQKELRKNARKTARTRSEIKLLTAQAAGKVSSKSAADSSNAIVRALAAPVAGYAPAPAVVVQAAADQVAVAKQEVLAKAAALARLIADAEAGAAQVSELKANAATAAEVASGTEGSKADKNLAEARADSAEASRLEGLLVGLSSQVNAASADAEASFEKAVATVQAVAADFVATTGAPHDTVVDALLHEGEASPVRLEVADESDYGFAFGFAFGAIPRHFRDRDGQLRVRTTESDAVWQALYEGAGHGAAASQGASGSAPTGQQVEDAVDTGLNIFKKIWDTFAPKQPPAEQPPPATSYRDDGDDRYREPAATDWTPILLAGGAALGIGALAAFAFRGDTGGSANMLMSRDRDGEFVTRGTAAPGYLHYEGESRHMPSRNRKGQFVAGTRRAPSRGHAAMQPEDVEWAAWYDPEDPLVEALGDFETLYDRDAALTQLPAEFQVEHQLVPGSDAAHDAAVYAARLRRRHKKPPSALFRKMFQGEATKAEKDRIQLWMQQERRIKKAFVDRAGWETWSKSNDPTSRPKKRTSQSNRASGYANFDEFGELTEIEFD